MNARRRAAKIESSDDIAVFIYRLVFRHSLSRQFIQIVVGCKRIHITRPNGHYLRESGGVRPSSGAANAELARALVFSRTEGTSIVAAPETGARRFSDSMRKIWFGELSPRPMGGTG